MRTLPIHLILFVAIALLVSSTAVAAGDQSASDDAATAAGAPAAADLAVRTHQVRAGDWLSKIAAQYGTTVGAIMAANDLADDAIEIGDTLVIPKASRPSSVLDVATPKATRGPLTSGRLPAAEPVSQPATDAVQLTGESAQEPPGPADNAPPASEKALSATSGESPATVPGDEPAAKAGVEIPTLEVPTVKPLSRSWAALGIFIMILLAMVAHPRSRRLMLDRFVGIHRGRGSAQQGAIDILASCTVGANQRILSLAVEDHRLVVGVSQGRMDVLHRWTTELHPGSLSGANDASPAFDEAAADVSLDPMEPARVEHSALAAAVSGQTMPRSPAMSGIPRSFGVGAGAGAATARVATVSLENDEAGIDVFPTTASMPTVGEAAPSAASPAQVAPASPESSYLPSSDHLMSLWERSVDRDECAEDLPLEDDESWWMEGATLDEMDRLDDADVATVRDASSIVTEVQADLRRARAADDVLAALRTRRLVDEDSSEAGSAAQATERAPSAARGHRAARLGRRPRLSKGGAAASAPSDSPRGETASIRRTI